MSACIIVTDDVHLDTGTGDVINQWQMCTQLHGVGALQTLALYQKLALHFKLTQGRM